MNHRPLAASFALGALLLPLPVAFGAATTGDDVEARVAELVDRMMDDVKNGVTYECNCGERPEGEPCPTVEAPAAKLVGLLSGGEGVIRALEPSWSHRRRPTRRARS
jgi:hypothetical protein